MPPVIPKPIGISNPSFGGVQPSQYATGNQPLNTATATAGTQVNVPSIIDNIQAAKQSIGQAPTISAPPSVASAFKAPEPIKPMDQSYWDALTKQRTDLLNQQYFGTGGVKDIQQTDIIRRGLVGQAPESKILEANVYQPYGQALTSLNNQVTQAIAQNQFDVDKANADIALQSQDILSKLYAIDSSNQLESQKASAEISATYNRLFSDIAKAQSDQDLQAIATTIDALNTAILQKKAETDALLAFLQLEGYGAPGGGQSGPLA